KKLQRNLKTKEKKKCTVVNKFSMRINQHHPKTAKFIHSERRFPEHMGGFFSYKNGQSQTKIKIIYLSTAIQSPKIECLPIQPFTLPMLFPIKYLSPRTALIR
ncbi:MAG: hypothetical protein AAF587_26945, partial [Bacteroidota bacterium]